MRRGPIVVRRLVGAAVMASAVAGCGAVPSTGAPPEPTPRPADDRGCFVVPRPASVEGLGLKDARTQRVAPQVVGERVLWARGHRSVTAWAGVDALDAFEDLDFLPVPLPAGEPNIWTTDVNPDLVVAAVPTSEVEPCDVLFVSTTGLPPGAAGRIATRLEVRYGTKEQIFGTTVP